MRQVAAGDGSILLAQEYDPYGQRLDAAGSGSSGYGYAGEQWDGSTGLIFLRARWFDPRTGRFVSKDTFWGIVGAPQTLNLYAYCLNDPINCTDPSGNLPPWLERILAYVRNWAGTGNQTGNSRYPGPAVTSTPTPPPSTPPSYPVIRAQRPTVTPISAPTIPQIVATSTPAPGLTTPDAFYGVSDATLTPIELLIGLFESSDLPGQTASARLDWVLERTIRNPGLKIIEHVLRIPTLYTGGGPRLLGGEGMKCELSDDYLYRVWYPNDIQSPQVGHFLTAAAWGRWSVDHPDSNLDLVFIVGHELASDKWGSDLAAMPRGLERQLIVGMYSPLRQIYFAMAAQNYENEALREALLSHCGAPSWYSPYAVGSSQRVGNSMEDLRLSALGWNLGRKIGYGELAEPQQVADWLNVNVKR